MDILKILGEAEGSLKSKDFKFSWIYNPTEKTLTLIINDLTLEYKEGIERTYSEYYSLLDKIQLLKITEENFHFFFASYATEFERQGSLLSKEEYKRALFWEKLRFAFKAWITGRRLNTAITNGIESTYKLAIHVNKLKELFEEDLDKKFNTRIKDSEKNLINAQKKELNTQLRRTLEIIVNNFIMQNTIFENFYGKNPVYDTQERELKNLKRL